jgi:hypothetical protein
MAVNSKKEQSADEAYGDASSKEVLPWEGHSGGRKILVDYKWEAKEYSNQKEG